MFIFTEDHYSQLHHHQLNLSKKAEPGPNDLLQINDSLSDAMDISRYLSVFKEIAFGKAPGWISVEVLKNLCDRGSPSLPEHDGTSSTCLSESCLSSDRAAHMPFSGLIGFTSSQ